MRVCEAKLWVAGVLPESEGWPITFRAELPDDAASQAKLLPLFNSTVRAGIVALLERNEMIGLEQSDSLIIETETETEPIDSPNEFAGFAARGQQ